MQYINSKLFELPIKRTVEMQFCSLNYSENCIIIK